MESSLNTVIKSGIINVLNEYMEKERDHYMKNMIELAIGMIIETVILKEYLS
ncbi:hypothetical protein DFR56_104230 [Pseudogracilibacillus auburnensis]|uniref:Uncharacterized protein n=1 Tax=Pseudogracilibacillus auburnensis TaxID=1494959 RepID=A0A2V3W1C6_9BACI|nr:hypothetical protein DFR56_104230 [Pseudogracilibacillus auburnensis]